MSMRKAVKAATEGVKSASRAMAVFELFRDQRRPLSAREISGALSMPRSSTNVLLKSLIADGYLRYDENSGSYFPTLRVFQIGSWIIEGFLHSPQVDEIMRDLAEETLETVCLWTLTGTTATTVKVIDSPQPIALSIRPGSSAPLFSSAVGLAFLARMAADKIDSLHEKWLRGAAIGEQRRLDLVERAQAVRDDGGISLGYDFWLSDAAAAAAAFSHPSLGEDAVLAVGGPVFRVRRNEAQIVAALHKAINRLNDHIVQPDIRT